MAAFVVAALILPQSFRLTAICDVTDSLLLASGVAAFVPHAMRARGRMRLFWSLIILGLSFWLFYQLVWTYYEVALRRQVPDLFAGDIVLFLDIVPLMAALALRPHVPRDEYAARLGRLDFALLLVWWIYLYVLIVIPWQYVEPNAAVYNRDLDAVYLAEKVAFLVGLGACWIGRKGPWRGFYANLFGMSLSYVASSTVANWAIARNVYYSGSIYDVPLAFSMGWLTWIGLRTRADAPETEGNVSTVYGVWIARCSMIAVFSLPLFAAWAVSDATVPPRIRVFRLSLTLAAAFVMGIMVFVRQYLLDHELTHLLDVSRESFDTLKRLQAQILQSEKLASIAQLVGGAAHELNNPITAMLGYSDLLLSTPLSAEQQPLAAKIGHHVRRTRSLVASLVSFARPGQAAKTLIDLNTLARTAVKLTQPQWESLKIEVRSRFDTELPKALGDSNQLLQVCLQLVGNCLHVMSERGSKVLAVSTHRQGDAAVLQIATAPVLTLPAANIQGASPIDSEDSLGLTACQGILQEHRGQISRQRGEDGTMLLRVELPASDTAAAKTAGPSAPVLWQSQPFA